MCILCQKFFNKLRLKYWNINFCYYYYYGHTQGRRIESSLQLQQELLNPLCHRGNSLERNFKMRPDIYLGPRSTWRTCLPARLHRGGSDFMSWSIRGQVSPGSAWLGLNPGSEGCGAKQTSAHLHPESLDTGGNSWS